MEHEIPTGKLGKILRLDVLLLLLLFFVERQLQFFLTNASF